MDKEQLEKEVKVYLPQDPQEAFFWETIDLFQRGFRQLNKKHNKIVYTKF